VIPARSQEARGERWRVRSDWIAVERERGISVSSAVMSFEHQGHLPDRPSSKAVRST
jgi:peptide subunit release factor RF-3